MLVDWIYGNPIWLVGTVITVVAVLATWGALMLVHRRVPLTVRQEHNDALYFMGETVGVLVAILLALVAVAVWENFSKGDEVAEREASQVGNMFRDTVGLQDSLAQPIRDRLKAYTNVVIDEEWPAQQAGRVEAASFKKGWDILASLHVALAQYQPQRAGQTIVEGEMLRTLNQLYDTRRSRILAAQGHLPAVVWWIMAIGAAMTVGSTLFFGMPQSWMHFLITGAVAASLALVFVLIVALDYPFRGEVSVSSDAFESVRQLNVDHPSHP